MLDALGGSIARLRAAVPAKSPSNGSTDQSTEQFVRSLGSRRDTDETTTVSPSSTWSAAARSSAPATRGRRRGHRARHGAQLRTGAAAGAADTRARYASRTRVARSRSREWALRFTPARQPRAAGCRAARGARQPAALRRRATALRTAACGAADGRARAAACAHADTARVALVRACRQGRVMPSAARTSRAVSRHLPLALHPLARSAASSRSPRWACGPSAIACVCRATVLRGVSSRRCSTMLDRAVGRLPDPRAAFHRRANGSRPDATSSPRSPTRRASTRPSRRCSTSCARSCAKRRCSVQALELRLVHREAAPTRLRLRFVEPVDGGADASRSCCSERLARIELPEPVRALRLRSGPLVELAGSIQRRCSRWIAASPAQACRNSSSVCVPVWETEAVYGLCLVPEHRPESAWRVAEPALPAADAEPQAGRPKPGSRRTRFRGDRCGCSPSRSRSTAASSRASKACSSSSRGPSASRAAGGTAATSGATTTSPAIRPACGCGCSAIAAAGRALVPAWRVRLSGRTCGACR